MSYTLVVFDKMKGHPVEPSNCQKEYNTFMNLVQRMITENIQYVSIQEFAEAIEFSHEEFLKFLKAAQPRITRNEKYPLVQIEGQTFLTIGHMQQIMFLMKPIYDTLFLYPKRLETFHALNRVLAVKVRSTLRKFDQTRTELEETVKELETEEREN